MNQNTTVDNDLQKAIDDITNNTNPVFADPVAAPSSVPAGDTGEVAEPIGPFPEPEPVFMPASTPFGTPATPNMNYAPEEIPVFTENSPVAPEPTTPNTIPEASPMGISIDAPETPAETITPSFEASNYNNDGLNVKQIKEAALRDLIPLLDHLNINPSQKFNLYRNMFEDLRDYKVLEPAYHAANEITNDQERAEALLYLVESIDKM